jgi:hypothetical protein
MPIEVATSILNALKTTLRGVVFSFADPQNENSRHCKHCSLRGCDSPPLGGGRYSSVPVVVTVYRPT